VAQDLRLKKAVCVYTKVNKTNVRGGMEQLRDPLKLTQFKRLVDLKKLHARTILGI